jgi:hypothetical protein
MKTANSSTRQNRQSETDMFDGSAFLRSNIATLFVSEKPERFNKNFALGWMKG